MKLASFTALILIAILPLAAKPFKLDTIDPIYRDEELVELWDSLSSVENPTYDDYLRFQQYLKFGRRPYLDPLFQNGVDRGWLEEEEVIRSVTFSGRIL